MQIDGKTFIVNSPVSCQAFKSFSESLFMDNKYVTFTWRFGEDRSLDQNSLLSVWLRDYAAHLLNKDKKAVTEAEHEGMKKVCKKAFYAETGEPWMVYKPIDPKTGEEGQLALRSSANYKTGEMFMFLTFVQNKAADDGLVLESLGQFNKLQGEQNE